MGTSITVSQFAGKLERAGEELKKAQRGAVKDAAAILQKGSTTTLLSAAPGGHLRNVKGSKLSVGVAMSGTEAAPIATVSARGSGFAILDNPTKQHWIGIGKSTKKVKNGFEGPARPGKKAGHPMLTPQGWRTGPFMSPGTKGKRTFHKGAEAATPAAMTALAKGSTLAVEGVFR